MSSLVLTVGVSPPAVGADSVFLMALMTRKTESAPTAGGDTPTVKTREDINLEVRQLNVREVRDVAPTCVVNP